MNRKTLLLGLPAIVFVTFLAWSSIFHSSAGDQNTRWPPRAFMPQDKGSSNTGASTAMTDFGPGSSTTIESTTRSSEIVTNASEDAVPDYQTAANTISFKQGRTVSKQSLPGEGFTVNPFPIPLAFFDSSSVVPATEENAAAMQRIKSDFVNATSGASSNPADPGFADRWLQFQPTADERFYAIFGVEAFNALTIMEARERGHF